MDMVMSPGNTHIYENEEIVRRINLDEIPLTALRSKSNNVLSNLNSIKIFPSEEGLPRDWRGLQHVALDRKHNDTFSQTHIKDPTALILSIWSKEKENCGSLGQLQKILGLIDRWDLVDDTNSLFLEDAEFYLNNKDKKNPKFTVNIFNPDNQNLLDSDANILTKHDVLRAEKGLPPQVYDAFLLFVDEDMIYAMDVIQRMEAFGFKLCVKDRDLLGGISFEHEAILRLISERCNRLIVIISNAFLQSNANKFFVNFGQALGIEQGRRKIIPCVFDSKTVLPISFSFYFILRYHRSGSIFDFWGKLKDSIQVTPRELIENKQIVLNPTKMIESDVKMVATENRTPRLLAISNERDSSRIQEINSTVVNYTRQKSESSVKTKLNMLAPSSSTLRTTSMLDLSKTNSTSLENMSEISKSTFNLSKAKKTKWYKKLFSNTSKEMEQIEKKEKKKKKSSKGIKVAEI